MGYATIYSICTSAVFLVLISKCYSRNYEIGIVIDRTPKHAFGKFLLKRSEEFVKDMNSSIAINPPG